MAAGKSLAQFSCSQHRDYVAVGSMASAADTLFPTCSLNTVAGTERVI